MSQTLKVISPGLLTSVQDMGRYGFQRYGVVVGGAMDTFALRIANLLVGNDEGEAALEITLLGPTVEWEESVTISISGANLSPELDGVPAPQWRPFRVKAGSVLRFTRPILGCRAYVAVGGGFDIPLVMGSKTTYLRGAIGGFNGRPLRAGDILQIRTSEMVHPSINTEFISGNWFIDPGTIQKYVPDSVIRVVPGPEFNLFTAASQRQLWTEEYLVTSQSDRMGCRLDGPPLRLVSPMEILSQGVTSGTIQVPPSGHPIALMSEAQTTGGYPRIAQVITVDLPLLAQVKPGDRIRFREVTVETAQRLLRRRERNISILKESLLMRNGEAKRSAYNRY